MKHPFTFAVLMVAAFFSFVVVIPFYPPSQSNKDAYFFEATLTSTARGSVQVFFDIGRGFNEADSSSVAIQAGVTPKLLKFPLPAGSYRALRFDPLNCPGTVTVTNARIRDYTGAAVTEFPPSMFVAFQQIKQMSLAEQRLVIETAADGYDPIVLLKLEKPLELIIRPFANWRKTVESAFLVFASLLLAIWTFSRIPSERFALIRGRIRERPFIWLAGVAVSGLMLNSYPIIFFGKSFISPNNGVLLLYETMPTVPGYEDTAIEDGKGSDVGAAMWWHVPISRIQHKALLIDHELPLWNRYDLCGQPLLGQGQSMIGDPLHLLTAVLFDGSSAAWDAKYLISKWIFAFGIGMTIFALTGRFSIASILSVSSLFIGFFTFRLNHPAFFSLCYSPWILFFWLRIIAATTSRGTIRFTIFLLIANWCELNSGTVKEAYMLIACLNGAGIVMIILDSEDFFTKLKKGAIVLWGYMLLFLISAPIWMVFLDTLKKSFTSYNTPDAQQLSPTFLIGLFEDLFYSQMSAQEIRFDPSANFLILLGLLWSLINLRVLVGNRRFLSIAIVAAISLSLVYGFVPKALVIKIPFVSNILHIDNTFSCVLIVLMFPLSGFGLAACWDSFSKTTWFGDLGLTLLLFAALLGLYFGANQNLAESSFFKMYAPSLALAFIVLPFALRKAVIGSSSRLSFGLVALLCLLMLHWRHGQYLRTAFDSYVFNPQQRVDLRTSSPAIREIEKRTDNEPIRILGLGLNLFPGFNQMLLLESIYGVDALRSREFEDFAQALGLSRVLAFTSAQPSETSEQIRAAYNAFNVGHYLASASPSEQSVPGWNHIGKFDLSVYASPTVWPRAFLVGRTTTYLNLADLVGLVRSANGHPFAAINQVDLTRLPEISPLATQKDDTFVRATNYKLTANATSFKIDTPTAGLVVLSETWLNGDFKASINDHPAGYFRVNHAFKGLYLNAPGTYNIRFEYWPRHFTLALWLAGLGLFLLTMSFLFTLRRSAF